MISISQHITDQAEKDQLSQGAVKRKLAEEWGANISSIYKWQHDEDVFVKFDNEGNAAPFRKISKSKTIH